MPGNLYATLALRDPAPPDRLATLSLAAAVAVREALAGATGSRGFRLKWPNDVLLDGAKVAGILLEAFVARGVTWATVGCGINCRSHPPVAAYPTTDLASAGLAMGPDHLFAALDERMIAAIDRWNRGAGLDAIRDEWMRHAHGLHAPATVRTPAGTLTGTMRGLAPDGRLLLGTNDGTVTVSAGDLAPPTERMSD